MSLNLNDSKAISIHAPARGATDFPRHSCRRSHAISIHAPARGATKRRPVKFTFPDDFNPRSREGSDQIQREAWDYGEDFNPRSREGSDVLTMQQFPAIFSISIHAPARGATIKPISSISSLSISIHAPARGATISRPGILRSQHISIHAPARGATKIPGHKDGCPVFQSTLPRGERQDKNPVDTLKILISIHAPARGATSRQGPHRRLICISIHAPARGATLLPEHSSAVSGTFQSTLPRGERHKSRLRY